MALFAIEINTIMPSNWTSRSIVQLSYMATKRSLKSFCKPKVKQKISFNCVGISSFHFIAVYSKTDGVTWWIVMVIWWTRYWTQDLFFFLLICDLIWIYMRYIFGVIYCMYIDSRDVGLITCSRSNPLVNINLGGNIQIRTETQSWSK